MVVTVMWKVRVTLKVKVVQARCLMVKMRSPRRRHSREERSPGKEGGS